MLKRLLPLVLLSTALVGTGCQPKNDLQQQAVADSAPPTQQGAANTSRQLQDERLWLTPPQGWQLISNEETKSGINDTLIRHLRYADPTEATHTLTLESRFNNTLGQPLADPLILVDQLANLEQSNCSSAEDFNTFTGFEQGVATAVRLFVCDPTEFEGGRVTLLKIMQGQNETYLVALQHQWSESSSNTTTPDSLELARTSNNLFDRVATWSMYLRKVRLCPASGCQQEGG